MSGPRDPTSHEADMYKSAVATKDKTRLRSIVDMYPNVVWGSITKVLSEEDRNWVMQNLREEPQPFGDEDEWG